MTKKALILLFALICICISVYVWWTIQVSDKKRSDDLAAAFNKTNRSLSHINDSLQKNADTHIAVRRDSFYLPEVELAIKANGIVRCIDSIKHDLVILTNQKEVSPFSYPNSSRLLYLKNNLANYNTFIQKQFSAKPGIQSADLIDLADIRKGTASIPWEVYYFNNTNVFSVITELTFINTQVLRLQQKAIK